MLSRLTLRTYLSFIIDGIAVSTALSIVNYFLLGFGIQTDGYYIHSFEIFLAILAVFPGSGNLGYIMLEYRLDHRSLIDSTIETCTWILFLSVIPSVFQCAVTNTRFDDVASSSSGV
jgi:hypothetical protein